MTDYKTFKEYYDDPEFRVSVNAYKAEKIKCECGSSTSRSNLYHHKKTQKHIDWVNKYGDLKQIQVDDLRKRITSLENFLYSPTKLKEVSLPVKETKTKPKDDINESDLDFDELLDNIFNTGNSSDPSD